MDVNKTIRSLCIHAGIKQGVFAERVGVSQSYLCAVEYDKRKPSIGLLERVAKELNVPLNVLFPIEVPDRALDLSAIRIFKALEELRQAIVELFVQ